MYKAFEDFYKEARIRHLVLEVNKDELVSPPFGTQNNPSYDMCAFYKDHTTLVSLDVPDATSKFNAVGVTDDSIWLIPYGIYDDLNVVVQIKDKTPIYHKLDKKGKGQFYSVASHGNTACSFPLGYEDTQFLIYINDNKVKTINVDTNEKKAHMGTVYCNGSYYSMPRGESVHYSNILEFDGKKVIKHKLDLPEVSRKYTDAVVVGNKLFSLPFGETAGLNEVIEFDTKTKEYRLWKLNVDDFAKKYNTQVLVDDVIIGLPYGDEDSNDSDKGIIFDTVTKESFQFSIKESYGGKFRYRSGIAYKGSAYFLPAGTPGCALYKIDTKGIWVSKTYPDNLMFGRPVIYNDEIHTIVYNTYDNSSNLVKLNDSLDIETVAIL